MSSVKLMGAPKACNVVIFLVWKSDSLLSISILLVTVIFRSKEKYMLSTVLKKSKCSVRPCGNFFFLSWDRLHFRSVALQPYFVIKSSAVAVSQKNVALQLRLPLSKKIGYLWLDCIILCYFYSSSTQPLSEKKPLLHNICHCKATTNNATYEIPPTYERPHSQMA